MSFTDLLLKLAAHTPIVGQDALKEVNRVAINHFATSTPPRPRPFSLWSAVPAPGDPTGPVPTGYVSEYTSWPGLTNKQYSARHLPPADPAYVAGLPADTFFTGAPGAVVGDVTKLFQRQGPMTPSRSSLLFMFFAQWFTDSVLRVDMMDRRLNTSNHDIDLCQIYGLTEAAARMLRKPDESGELRSQNLSINGVDEEFPEYLCQPAAAGGGYGVRPEFEALRAQYAMTADAFIDQYVLGPPFLDRKSKLYATGLERGNSTIGYVTVGLVFLREHNRLARAFKQQNPGWDGERIFQTARNVNTVLLLKLVVEDYINHILGHDIFRLDHDFAEDQAWYRPNWIAIEFDLLYRWHGLAPDSITVGGVPLRAQDFRNNNALLERVGVGALVDAASRQAAGKITLGNTPDYLWPAESWSVKMSRSFRLRSLNDYRERFSLPRHTSFTEVTSDVVLQSRLAALYKTVDDVELVVGLFAEEAEEGLLFGELLNKMVAYDAFTQIFTNPLLSRNVYGPATFSDYGVQVIAETTSVNDLVNRNVAVPVRASLGV